MNFKLKLTLLTLIIFTSLLVTSSSLLAQQPSLFNDSDAEKGLQAQDTAFIDAAGLSKTVELRTIISIIIKTVLSLLGVIFVILLIYAGLSWMTSAGNEEKIAKAKKTLTAAIIGLAIVIAAYAITTFVINNLLDATGVISQ